jgi:ketosteroid isomerase-like protein
VRKFFEAFSESRFDDALELMDDEGNEWVAGSTEISGTCTQEEFRELASGVAGGTKVGIRLSPTGITAEGDSVEVESVSDVETLEGKRYLNYHHFLFEFKNRKFIAIHQYIDPMHVQEVFGAQFKALVY